MLRSLVSGCGTSPTDRVFLWFRCVLVGGYEGHRPFASWTLPAYCFVCDGNMRMWILGGGDVAFAPAHTGRVVLARPMVADALRARFAFAMLGGRSRPVVSQYVSLLPFARVCLGTVPTSSSQGGGVPAGPVLRSQTIRSIWRVSLDCQVRLPLVVGTSSGRGSLPVIRRVLLCGVPAARLMSLDAPPCFCLAGRRGVPMPFCRRSLRLFVTPATWLILPVVICLSQRLSHARLSVNTLHCETANGSLNQLSFIWWSPYHSDNRGNSRANTCSISRLLEGMYLLDKRPIRACPLLRRIMVTLSNRMAFEPAMFHSNFCPINFRW